jgi:hypothetical protein
VDVVTEEAKEEAREDVGLSDGEEMKRGKMKRLKAETRRRETQ